MLNKKRLLIILSIFTILSVCFSMVAFAEDLEISQCDVTNEVCQELQKLYGTDSSVLFSFTESESCKDTVNISLADGSNMVVFVSAQPGETPSDPPVIDAPGTNTNPGLNDTGVVIKPGPTGINEIELPNTSVDDILNWATTKGNEVIYLLQIFCQPFAIIIFIIAAFMTLIGCIGKADMVGKGIWGMVLSVVVYAAVLYAPVILQAFVGWVAS
jgi:hypothetical protein